MGQQGSHVMQCMEVWGGNRAIDNGVVMPGIDAWVFSVPHGSDAGEPEGKAGEAGQAAGGDIHYVTSCATGRVTRLIVADVSGHGQAVAQAAEALRRLMRRFSNYIDQTRLVEALNSQFGEIAGGNDGDGVSAMFATAVVATYFAPTDELSICNAGHPRPLRYSARTGSWTVLMAESTASGGLSNLPLGVAEPTRYPKTVFRLGRDDLVLFYTDSLIEARVAGGKMLGQDGLVRLLGGMDPSRPESLIRTLLGRIAAEGGVAGGSRGDGPDRPAFDDDVTALLVRRNQFKPRPSPMLSLIAAGRIVKHAIASLLPGGQPASLPELGLASLGGAAFSFLNRPTSEGDASVGE